MTVRQVLETTRAVVRNLALGGNAAALSLAGSPRRLLAYCAESLFLFRTWADRRGIPQRNVFEVLGDPGPVDITLGNLSGTTWFTATASYASDLIALCLMSRILNARTVFEIGTLEGYSAYHFALNTPDDSTVYTLDLPQAVEVQPALHTTVLDDAHIRAGTHHLRRVFEGTPVAHKIRPLYGDSATFDFTPYHGTVDLFFVDGAHSYDYVASDTANALRCVRPGGVVAWHDFGRTGVNGVSRLVQEMAVRHPVQAVPGSSVAYMVVPESPVACPEEGVA